MGQVQIRINGRSYEIACDDGEEDHVAELGRFIDKRVGDLAQRLGQVGDSRLLVMAALVIADELSEAYGALEDARLGELAAGRPALDSDQAANLSALAERIDLIAAGLERT